VLQKFFEVVKLDLVIIFVNEGVKLDLLEMNDFLFFSRLFFLLRLVIFELAKVHDPANRR
jgi:hypothetical protein